MTTELPPPGWYDDPERDDRQRWWDGTSWSQTRRPRASDAAVGFTSGTPSHSTPERVPAPEHVVVGGGDGTRTLANPMDRLAAAVLDGVLAVVVLAAAGLVGAVVGVLSDALSALIAGALSLAAWVLIVASNVMGEGRLGQSYGKHVVGISVVSTRTGEPIGSAAAVGRNIIRGIGAYIFGLGVLWMLWDSRRQGWHDKAVSSVVVKTRGETKVDPLTFMRAILDSDPGALTRRERLTVESTTNGDQ